MAIQEYILRKGTTEDFEQLYSIYMHPTVCKFLNFEIMPSEEFMPVFSDMMNMGDLYVYTYQDRITATCIVIKHKRRCAHIRTLGSLAVHPDYHRSGVGTQFMTDVVSMLKNEGVIRIDLGAEADNIIALNFYKKMGFQCEGVLKKYVKRAFQDEYLDEHWMALILD